MACDGSRNVPFRLHLNIGEVHSPDLNQPNTLSQVRKVMDRPLLALGELPLLILLYAARGSETTTSGRRGDGPGWMAKTIEFGKAFSGCKTWCGASIFYVALPRSTVLRAFHSFTTRSRWSLYQVGMTLWGYVYLTKWSDPSLVDACPGHACPFTTPSALVGGTAV